jgi:hypothetical protein
MLAASAYDSHRTLYHANGYTAVHPIGPNTKVPMVFVNGEFKNMIGWQDLNRTMVTAPQPGAGIGVRLGLQRGGLYLIALDWDDDVLSGVAMSRFPSPVCKVGRRGHTAFFTSRTDIAPKNFKIGGACRLQVLSTGQQTVLPPTVHPDTKEPYWWLDDWTFENVKIENLPQLPSDYLEMIAKIFEEAGMVPDPEEPKTAPEGGYDDDNPYAELNALALRNLPKWILDVGIPRCRRTTGPCNFEGVAGWRESSRGLPIDERIPNLKMSPKSIKDWGADKGYSPINLVMVARGCDRAAAIGFLQERLFENTVSDDSIDRLVEALKEPAFDGGVSGDDPDDGEKPNEEKKAEKPKNAPIVHLLKPREFLAQSQAAGRHMIGGLIRFGTITAIGARPQGGKTAVVIAILKHIEAGEESFLGFKIPQEKKVVSLYIAAEDPEDVAMRIDAAGLMLTFVVKSEEAFVLTKPARAVAIVEVAVRQAREKFPDHDIVVIVDTMRAALGGASILEDRAAAPALNALRTFVENDGAAMLICNHTNRSNHEEQKGETLEAVAAAEIILLREENHWATVKTGKNRNGGRAYCRIGRMHTTERETDLSDGNSICFVDELEAVNGKSEAAPKETKRPKPEPTQADRFLAKLKDAIAESPVRCEKAPGGLAARRSRWFSDAEEAEIFEGNKNPEARMRQLKKALKDEGLIDEDEDAGLVWIALPRA